jgi:predicted MFS family arabinose efflux permease
MMTIDAAVPPSSSSDTPRRTSNQPSPTTETSDGGLIRPLKEKDFRRFFLSAVVSNAGSWMQATAIPFVVYDITNSKSWLGITAFTSMFVGMAANTPGGILADRYERRRVLMVTQAGLGFVALGLWALWSFGTATIASIFPFLLLGSVCSGLTSPAWQSLIPSLVRTPDLPAAVRLNSMQFNLARSLGPLLAAVTLKGFGPAGCFLANAITYPIIIAVLWRLPNQRIALASDADFGFRVAIANVREGWQYLLGKHNLMLPPLTSLINAAFGFGLSGLAPALAKEHFGHPANDNGILLGAFGIGGVLGILGSSLLANRYRRSTLAQVAILTYCFASIAMISTHSFVFGCLAFAIAGMSNGTVAAALNTALQLQVKDQFRGRVMGSYSQMFFLGAAFGSLLLGVVADQIGLWAAPVLSALAFFVYLLVARNRFERLTLLDKNSPDD